MRIVIPQKQLQSLTRNMIINSDDSGWQQSQKIYQRALELWLSERDSANFMAELERITELNLWKQCKVDVVMCLDLFNMLDELLELLAERQQADIASLKAQSMDAQSNKEGMIDTSTNKGAIQLDAKMFRVLKFLKVITLLATNIQYFNSIERIVKIYDQYKGQNNLLMIEDLIGVLITLSSRQHSEKKPTATIKQGLDRFNDEITGLMRSAAGLVRSFDFIIDLISLQGNDIDYHQMIESKIKILSDSLVVGSTTPIDDKVRAQIEELRCINQKAAFDRQYLEEVFVLLLRKINLYLSVGDLKAIRDKITQGTELEHLLPPKLFVRKIIQVLSTQHLSKRVHIQAMNVFFLFIILDLNQLFNYIQPADNQYYSEACNHYEKYTVWMQQLARYHAYEKLKSGIYEDTMVIEGVENEIQQMIQHQKDLVGDEGDTTYNQGVSDTIKSQRFFNSFLNFMCNLLNFKNRQLQTQLYPQLLKPLLAIVYVKPNEKQVYPININCQLKAAKLLKEVVKMSSIEDPGAVERVIDRLKDEIRNLHVVDTKWHKMADDDCESDISNSYRQDLIRTLLRFLSYTIIRNDPNAINFTQNFVANSRKILDSNLIQDIMINYIFNANMTMSEIFLSQTIDPVILQCVQLISYLFNDLPQKIPQFIELGVFKQILDSLTKRMPIQPDLIILVMKFVQTICLNSQGSDLVVSSNFFGKFASIACDAASHKLIVNPNKVMVFTDVVQQVAGQNKEIAGALLTAIMKNFEVMIDRSWDITQKYVLMEKTIREKQGITKQETDSLRFKYEKEQVHLELTFESCSNMLWFFTENDGAQVGNTVTESFVTLREHTLNIIERVITTPIVASACSNMFPIFIESLLQILSVLGHEAEVQFVQKVLNFIDQQLVNMERLLGTTDFDSISDVETSVVKCVDLKLAETEDMAERLQIINELKEQDQASVVFGKIAFYCEIIWKCLPDTKSKLFQMPQFHQMNVKIFKLQALVNRFHAVKYEKDILKEISRMKELINAHKNVIGETDFSKFTLIKEPLDEEDELKNLYFRYEIEKIPSLTDSKARESFKTAIELQLDENISHTSNMCQQAIRKLIMAFLKQMNRNKKIHFSEKIDVLLLQYNQMVGGLIAEEFMDFRKVTQNNNGPTETEVMKYCCQFSAVFSEFNKVLFGNYSFGVLLLEFINKGGLECIKEIILWIVQYIFVLERTPQPKSLNQCKNIQLLWSHLIDFFVQLLEGKYIDVQFQQFLICFKTNPDQAIKADAPMNKYNLEFQGANKRMKEYFIDVFTASLKFLFVELNECKWVTNFKLGTRLSVFEYFDQISELFLVSMVDIYNFASKGFEHIKFLTAPIAAVAPKSIDEENASKIKALVNMGFKEEQAKAALSLAKDNMAYATHLLLSHPMQIQAPIVETTVPAVTQIVKDQSNQFEEPQYRYEFKIGDLTRRDMFQVVAASFKDYLRFMPLTLGKLIRKSDIIDNIFFTLGSNTEEAIYALEMLKNIKQTILEQINECQISNDISNMGTLALSLHNLLSYQHGSLVQTKEVFQACFEMIALFQVAVKSLKTEVSLNPISIENPQGNWDKKKERIFIEQVRQIDLTNQLFMYITEEGKISSDLGKLNTILSQKSSLDDSIKDVEDQLDILQKINKQNIFHNNKEQTAELYHTIVLGMIELFKSLHQMDPQIEGACQQQINELILRGLESMNFLMNIKGFADFECQTFFLKNEGLKALLGICTLSKEGHFPVQQNFDSKRLTDIQIQSKILIQMLSQNDHSQIKVYENLIKSVLFIFFQERYKMDEGTELKKELAGGVTIEEVKHAQVCSTPQHGKNLKSGSSKKKQSQGASGLQSPPQQAYMKSKSQANDESAIKAQSKANQSRQNLLKKAELGEASLDDFIQFFNNIMQIQDFKSFLQACQNVCIIKKKKVPLAKLQPLDYITNILKKTGEQKKSTEAGVQTNVEEVKQTEAQATQQVPSRLNERNNRAQKRRESKAKQEAEELKQQEEQNKQSEPKVEEREAYFIMLNHQSMKDMITQFETNIQNLPVISPQENEKQLKGHIQQFQQEIVYTLLDSFIDQIRDQQMLILQHCKQKQNPSIHGLISNVDEKGRLLIKQDANNQSSTKLSYQNYLFDFVTILSHLTYLITHTPILVRSLLKHKDSKTFKFIIRNLYFLMTMVVEMDSKPSDPSIKTAENKLYLLFDHTSFTLGKRRVDVVNEFFKRVMFDNPHLTINERRAKSEARVIFQKEVLKNLCDSLGTNNTAVSNKYPQWPQLRILYNVGALWLLSIVLKEEEKDDQLKQQIQQDKNIENLVLNMQKYRNIFRQQMIKLLINECQQHHSRQLQISGNDANQFALLKMIEFIQLDILENIKFFESAKDPIQFCIQTLTNILKPFEGNKHVWGTTGIDGDKEKILGGEDLGFIRQPLAVEEAIDEDMIEEEDESSSDSEDDSNEEDAEDDELLDSELSERNFRFSQQDHQLDSADLINGDEGEEDEEDSYGDQDNEERLQRHRMRHHHHHHRVDVDESMEDSDESSHQYGDEEVEQAADQLMETLLQENRDDGDIIDYGQEGDEEGEEDYDDEIADQSETIQQDSALPRRQPDNQLLSSEFPNAEANEEEDEEDEFESDEEEEGEENSDEYYDEEIDDEDEEDQEEIQIYAGRNPDNISNIQDHHIRQHGGLRRDDIMSINNLSVDMFNIGPRSSHQHMHHIDDLPEASADFSVDQPDIQSQMNNVQAAINNVVSDGRPGQFEMLDDIIGMLTGNGNRGGRPGPLGKQLGSTFNLKEDVSYKPVMTMLEIVSLGKEIQRREDIYKAFIKEVQVIEDPNKIRSTQGLPPVEGNQLASGTDQEVASTKSQFSNKNPFINPAPTSDRNNIFGQFNPRILNNNPPVVQQTMINTATPVNRGRQELIIVDDLEIDPEFMENLDPSGLQNIAQTENLMNFITNQGNRQDGQNRSNVYSTVQLIESITNRDERQQMFRNMPQDIFNQLPPNLYTEGLIYRRIDLNNLSPSPLLLLQNLSSSSSNSTLQMPIQSFMQALRPQASVSDLPRARVGNVMPWPQVRSRIQSLDQQLNDITDFSRQQNDPHVVSNNNQDINATNSAFATTNRLLQNFMTDFSMKNNSIFNSFQLFLQDQLVELSQRPVFDVKGTDVTNSCQIIISQALLSNSTELNEHYYQRISGIIDMIMVWIKYLTNGLFILQKEQYLVKILFRVPHVRAGLLLKTLQWFVSGVEQLKLYDQEQNALALKHNIAAVTTPQLFSVERGGGLPGKIDLHNYILQCLRSFKKLSQDHVSGSADYGIELLKIPEEDPTLKSLITIINNQRFNIPTERLPELSLKKSIIGQIVDLIVTYFSIVKNQPGYITGDIEEDKSHDHYWDETMSALSTVFKQVYSGFKEQQEKIDVMQRISVDKNMIESLCHLILTTEFKNRSTQRTIKSIFGNISGSGEGCQVIIETFFRESLSAALLRFVEIVDESKIDNQKLKKEVTVINQILKFAKTSSKQEANICDQALFFRVVKSISGMIDRKQFDTLTSSIQQAAFMFKEEFRTVMTTLFILFEYNLKFIFTDTTDELQPASKKKKQRNAPQVARAAAVPVVQPTMQVVMQDAEEIKGEEVAGSSSKDHIQIEQAIDQHLKLKIKDEHAREDQRLKIFIKFCLEHKKVINSFIRANQQVLNDSLRNVIMKVPQVLDFDNKRLLFRSQIKKIQKKYRLKYFDIQIRRDKVFEDSYEQLKSLSAERWKGQMGVEFADEQGIDEGGLTREWFILLSQEIFNPDLALFVQSNAGSTYYPNPKSVVQPEYLSLFKFIGRLVGKALFEQQLLDCYFVKALYKIMLGLPLTYHDVEDFDNDLYRNLKWCLDNSVEGLGLTFSETRDYFGQSEEVELIEGGKDIEVSNTNKFDYVQKMAYQKLYNSIKKQVDAFLQGFYDIVPKQLVQIFDNRELELLISGLPNIDIMDLKENTVYQNYSAESPVVRWLFEVLEEFDNSERAEFIQFVTGSSKVPVEGFKGLRGSRGIQKFQIVKFFTSDTNRLPQAHTCFKQLELPEYESKDKLKERLLTAIKEGKTFGFA